MATDCGAASREARLRALCRWSPARRCRAAGEDLTSATENHVTCQRRRRSCLDDGERTHSSGCRKSRSRCGPAFGRRPRSSMPADCFRGGLPYRAAAPKTRRTGRNSPRTGGGSDTACHTASSRCPRTTGPRSCPPRRSSPSCIPRRRTPTRSASCSHDWSGQQAPSPTCAAANITPSPTQRKPGQVNQVKSSRHTTGHVRTRPYHRTL